MDGLVAVEDSEEATLHCSVGGYICYVYCAIWSAVMREILQCERELDNVEDCRTL